VRGGGDESPPRHLARGSPHGEAFGADAAVQPALRADEMFEAGDEHGTATWRAIVRAIGELQHQQLKDGERSH
jgi:hypothetical protein